jgi:competence protein ComEC
VMMWAVGVCAYLFRRSGDGVSSICLSGLVWLCYRPYDLFSPGFQLSYLVSGVLLLVFMRLNAGPEDSPWKALSLSGIVASAGSEPIAAWWFGRLNFVAPLTNILVSGVATIVMVLGFVSLLPWVGEGVALVVRPLLWFMQSISRWGAFAPQLELPKGIVPAWVFVLYYAGILLAVLGSRPKKLEP